MSGMDTKAILFEMKATYGVLTGDEEPGMLRVVRQLVAALAAEIALREALVRERKHIDATPDDSYPRRILEAYRRDCDFQWSDSSTPETPTSNVLIIAMNEMQEQRAAILDRAIAALWP